MNEVIGPIPQNSWITLLQLKEQIAFMEEREFAQEVIDRDREVFDIVLKQFKK